MVLHEHKKKIELQRLGACWQRGALLKVLYFDALNEVCITKLSGFKL